MSSIVFDIVWPGGNTTALVRGHVPVHQYPLIARRILGKYSDIEQVGFMLTAYSPEADGRMAMMGGEFCGNASRSAGFLLARELGKEFVHLEIPGMQSPIYCTVKDGQSSIRLPFDFCLSMQACPEGTIIDLQGIRHVVIEKKTSDNNEDLLRKYSDNLPAVGLIFVHTEESSGFITIDPHVWVRDTATLYHETACGSGTIAVGYHFHARNKKRHFNVKQPSGVNFTVEFSPLQKSQCVELSGPIEFRQEAVIEAD